MKSKHARIFVATRTNLRLAHYEVIQTNDWINWSGVDRQLCLSDAEPASLCWESKIELKSYEIVMIFDSSTSACFVLPCLRSWPGPTVETVEDWIASPEIRKFFTHVMPWIKDFQPFQFESFSWDISGCKAKIRRWRYLKMMALWGLGSSSAYGGSTNNYENCPLWELIHNGQVQISTVKG